jgi:hypothetical protein
MELNGLVGPIEGFSPQIGTLVTMLAFTRAQVVRCVERMSTPDLDYLIDGRANSIGATLLHLAATETYYQLNTFGGMKWDSWSDEIKHKWDIPMNLGEPARQTIKGHSVDFYLSALHETREKTIAEFRDRDDHWLALVDAEWKWTNHAKWFHVAEHESNHNGQFKFLRGRFPWATSRSE